MLRPFIRIHNQVAQFVEHPFCNVQVDQLCWQIIICSCFTTWETSDCLFNFTTWKTCFVLPLFSPSSTIWHCSPSHRCLWCVACLCTVYLTWEYARLFQVISVRDLLALRLLRLSISLGVSSVTRGLLVLLRLFPSISLFHLPELICRVFCSFC